MDRKFLSAVVILGVVVAALSGIYAKRQFERFVITTTVVTAKVDILSHAVIPSELLTTREVPKSFLGEPIAKTAQEVAGKVTLAPIKAGSLIYLNQLVNLSQWRLSGNPTLEIISFPISPERAVGGQIKRGNKINIYRIAIARPEMEPSGGSPSPAEELLSEKGAAVELLAEDVPVVDVRAGRGEPAGEVVTTQGGVLPGGGKTEAKTVPIAILTVAVPPETAKEIMCLQGEVKVGYYLWVTFGPMTKPTPTPSPLPVPARQTGMVTPTPTPSPSPTPTPTLPLPTSIPVVSKARVTADRLNVRSGPGTEYAVTGTVPKGDVLEIKAGGEAGVWLMVTTPAGIDGWVHSNYVEMEAGMETVPVGGEMPSPPLPTPAPAPTLGPTPAPTEPPAPTRVPLSLVNPPNGSQVSGGQRPILQWQGRDLAADEAYVARIDRHDKELGIYPEFIKTLELGVTVPFWIQDRLDGSRLCEWSVRIYRNPVLNYGDSGDAIVGGKPVGPSSETWSVTWAASPSKPSKPEGKPTPPLGFS